MSALVFVRIALKESIALPRRALTRGRRKMNPINGIKNFVKKIVVEVIKNSEITFDPKTKEVSVKFKKDI